MDCSKKFLWAIPLGFIAGLVVFLIAVRIQLGVPTQMSSWIMSAIEQKRAAANAIDEPKLVLLGGSATLFGIKASVLERELGMPVINGALHAGLGMAYILREGRNVIRPGDTVMLFPEYELYGFGEGNRRDWAAITYLDFIMSRDPEYFQSLSLPNQIEIGLMTPMSRLFTGIRGRWMPDERGHIVQEGPYRSELLDAHGDMTGHLAEMRARHSQDRDERICTVLCRDLQTDQEGFFLLKQFAEWAQANNVRVIAGFPNLVHRNEYDSEITRQVERKIHKFFSENGIEVIGSMRDAMMPVEEFFDTVYHPHEEASVRRSKRIAAHLRPVIALLKR